VPLHLEVGQRLRARLWGEDLVQPTLYLARSCDDPEPLGACAQAPTSRPWAPLEHRAVEAEDLLLILDSGQPAGSEEPQQLVLDLQIEDAPALWLSEDRVTRGGAQRLEVQAGEGLAPWSVEEPPGFDLGPDVEILDVQVTGPHEASFEARPAPDAALGWRDLSVTLAGDSVTLPHAVEVSEYLFLASCAEAEAVEPFGPGRYPGSTLFAGQDVVSGEPCLLSTAGTEVIVPVALGPGETLEATLSMPGADPVLYLQDACGELVLRCADEGSTEGWEYLRWTGPAEGAVLYLVVDGYGVEDAGEFELELEVWP
jgi:hypothetical protein